LPVRMKTIKAGAFSWLKLSSRKPPTGPAEGRPDDRLRGYPESSSPALRRGKMDPGSRPLRGLGGMTTESGGSFPLRQLQQFAELCLCQRRRDVFERDRVLHQLG